MTERVKIFFDKFEHARNSSNVELIAGCYSDSFMFCGNNGVQVVEKDDFMSLLPKRQAAFKSAGLLSSKINSLKELSLDENYYLVTVYWKMDIEKDRRGTEEIEASATFILAEQNSSFKIVLQLDHQDLMKRIEEIVFNTPHNSDHRLS